MFTAPVLDAPLIAGPLPTAISVAGAAGAVVLLAGRGRRWWLRSLPLSIGIGIAVAGLTAVAVIIGRPFPDLLPARILIWIFVAAAGCAVAWAGRRAGWRRRVAVAASLLAVLGTAAVKVNAFYGYRPTLATALGLPARNEADLAEWLPRRPVVAAPPGVALAALWRSPADMPHAGRIATAEIPGRVSGFAPRPAWLYLPPAYLGSRRAQLPVLVLIPGQPGGPEDWVLAGGLAGVLDRFAAAHDGLAPIVVVPDSTGSSWGNPMCLDSRLGAAETYLGTDVPAWVAANLQVDPHRFAIGGFSFGGTCALQLALRRPEVYPTFLDIAGQSEPTLGDHAGTVAAAFGGDEAAFGRVNPLDELRRGRFPGSAGVLAIGRDDVQYRPQAQQVAAAAVAAGMTVTLDERAGGHSWSLATDALDAALPWLAGRTGILQPVAARAP